MALNHPQLSMKGLSRLHSCLFPSSWIRCLHCALFHGLKIRFPGRGLRAQVLQEVGSTASPYTAGPLGEKA